MIRCKTIVLLILTLSSSAEAWYDCENDVAYQTVQTFSGPRNNDVYKVPDFENIVQFIPADDLWSYYVPECECTVIFLKLSCHERVPPRPLMIIIRCDSYDSNYTAIPYTEFEKFAAASNFKLIALHMFNCKLPSTFPSFVSNLGLTNAELLQILLVSTRGELQGAHVRGLRKLRKIVLHKAAEQNRFPGDLFNALPDLVEFQVSDTQLRLEGSEENDRTDGTSRFALQSLTLISCGINEVPSGAFAGLGNITELYLRVNFIKNFTRDAFRGLTNLELLNLSDNPITSLPPQAFAFTPRLSYLYLDDTQLRTVPGDAFQGLQHLEIISISTLNNSQLTFGARALALSSLKELIIQSALLSPLPKDLIEGSVNLQTLIIRDAGLKIIPKGFFTTQQRLQKLDLTENELTTLDADVFQSLQMLVDLDLSWNNKITFGARALALSSLKKLTIRRTLLSPLPKDLIEGSVNLQTLIIRDAGLKIIPKGFFSTQQRLQKLDLGENELTTLEADVFQSLQALVDLDLSGNRIIKFPRHIFDLQCLRRVSANNNRLQHIGADAFRAFNSITYLALNDNLLTSEALSFLSSFWFLKELRLRGNRISYMIPNSKQSHSLEMLDLSRNNITALKQADLMLNNSRLEINLRENNITNIKFHYLPSMRSEYKRIVFLDDNPLICDCELYMLIKASQYRPTSSFIPEITLEQAICASPPTLAGKLIQDVRLKSFTCSLPPQDCPANCTCNVRPETRTLELDCKVEPSIYPNPGDHAQKTTLRLRNLQSQPLTLPSHVVFLNLAGLGLTEPPLLKTHNIQKLDLSRNHLTDAPLELFKENITLRLSGNEFACDCSHLENVYVIQSNSAQIEDVMNITCKGGEYLMHINVEKLCEFKKESVIGVTLAVLSGLAVIVAGFFYRYSLEIKVFLFSRGWCRSWIQEDDVDNAEYDAFVSFSQDDAQWVAEQLLPILEGKPNNYKLCVHYRDWVIGEMIPAQIATSVEQSRRTIVVLTKNFLKSTWAQLEFRAANAHAQRDRRARVLIIVLGEIPDCEEMDAELRAYLSTNTYLKWEDPWFWEKLKYAMPHRRQNVG